MKHQPKSNKHRDKRHKIYPGKPSWGRKPNNFFSIDSIVKIQCQYNDLPKPRSNPSAKP